MNYFLYDLSSSWSCYSVWCVF